MANQWFKFYGGEYLADPKMGALTPQERSCWLTLLCLASMATEAGVIGFLTVEVLLAKSGIVYDPYHPEEWNNNLGVLKKFESMGMIELSEAGPILLKNWSKRQDANLSNAERQARFRAKSNASRYESNARIEEVTENVTEEITTITHAAAEPPPFNFQEYLDQMAHDPRRSVQLIAAFFKEKRLRFETKVQTQIAIKRHLRAANQLAKFEPEAVMRGVKKCREMNEEKKVDWTLETVVKMLTK